MAIQLDFSNAEEQRLRITQEQQEYIRGLYKQASTNIGKLAEQAPRVPSDALRQQYLHTLQGQIDAQLRNIERQLNGTIKSGMTDTAKATVADAKSFLKEAGLPIKGAYSHVPADIVRSVASGQLYTGNWTLSKALWLNTTETQHDVQSIVAQGIIQNKSAYDIAKDLEKYVDPTARKDWEWSKVYPGTKKVVDYNAQRLARTMVSHAYQQAFVRTTQKNPFVSKYKWEASNSERTCEICEERDGKLFNKDELPLDHPNGMCTFTAVMEDLDKIGERLGDWAAGKSDPELDKWAEDLYGKGWKVEKEHTQDNRSPEEVAKYLYEHRSAKVLAEYKAHLSGSIKYYKQDNFDDNEHWWIITKSGKEQFLNWTTTPAELKQIKLGDIVYLQLSSGDGIDDSLGFTTTKPVYEKISDDFEEMEKYEHTVMRLFNTEWVRKHNK